MKKKCAVCNEARGKRVCRFKKDNLMICSLCCASIRDYRCGECSHYKTSREYLSSSLKRMEPIKKKEKEFVIEINPEVEEAVDRALRLLERGRLDKSATIVRKLMKDHPGNHMVQYAMGVVFALKDQLDEAIKHFKRAVDIFPYFSEAHFNLAVAFQKKIDIKNAVRSFQKVIEYGEPGNERVEQANEFLLDLEQHILKHNGVDLETYLKAIDLFDEAVNHMNNQEWDNAIFLFQKSLEINKNSPQAYGNMGICLGKLGKKTEALEALDKALELDPKYELAAVNRMVAESLKEGEKLEAGEVDFTEYYKEYPMKKRSYLRKVLQDLKNSKTKK